MSAPSAVMTSSTVVNATRLFWGTFVADGLWRAGLISNALFATGVAAVALVLLGGTTGLRRILGPRRLLFSVHLAHHWPHLGSGREPILLSRSPAARADSDGDTAPAMRVQAVGRALP